MFYKSLIVPNVLQLIEYFFCQGAQNEKIFFIKPLTKEALFFIFVYRLVGTIIFTVRKRKRRVVLHT